MLNSNIYQQSKRVLVLIPFFYSAFLLASNQSDNIAINNYKISYQLSQKGLYQQAINYTKKSAQYGYPPAQHNLALSYKLGLGIKQNYNLAIKWFKKAANNNLVDAKTELGLAYYYGLGVKKDNKIAKKYWLSATKQNDEYAQFNLASLYLEQGRKILAKKYFKQALNNNHPQAKTALMQLIYEENTTANTNNDSNTN